MSDKAARGTKRLCQACGSKFYDLNRDPIHCPLCGAVFENEAMAHKVDHIADSDDSNDIVDNEDGPEIVSLQDVEPADSEDIPKVEGEDIDLDDDTEIPDAADEDVFLEEDDDGNTDVSGIIGNPIASNHEET
ncbi:MAG: TIGR02300 family protein [Pseudomonadota bacterium]